ncbi:hypothetical protein DAI22_05g241650 [Oryza sativa Japonica Group]|nr:hypothetical protein DAI22_05g241650 [Oryza sativa Japonica Group]
MLDRCSNPGFRARVGVAAAKSRRLVRAHAAQSLGSEAPPSTGARASARRDHDRSARRGARVQISAIKTDLARLSNDRCIARTRARVLTCAGRAVMRPPPPSPAIETPRERRRPPVHVAVSSCARRGPQQQQTGRPVRYGASRSPPPVQSRLTTSPRLLPPSSPPPPPLSPPPRHARVFGQAHTSSSSSLLLSLVLFTHPTLCLRGQVVGFVGFLGSSFVVVVGGGGGGGGGGEVAGVVGGDFLCGGRRER